MSSSNGHSVAVLDAPKDRAEYFGGKIDITHAFVPRDPRQPWGLCGGCGFAESAHLEAATPYAVSGAYRCPDCVTADEPACDHPRSGEQSL